MQQYPTLTGMDPALRHFRSRVYSRRFHRPGHSSPFRGPNKGVRSCAFVVMLIAFFLILAFIIFWMIST